MDDRDELIEAGKQALTDAWLQGRLLSQDKPGGRWHKDFGKFTATVLDAVEEKIRADERGKWIAYEEGVARDEWIALRAKVEALPYVLTYGTTEVKRDDVLALFGGSDE